MLNWEWSRWCFTMWPIGFENTCSVIYTDLCRALCMHVHVWVHVCVWLLEGWGWRVQGPSAMRVSRQQLLCDPEQIILKSSGNDLQSQADLSLVSSTPSLISYTQCLVVLRFTPMHKHCSTSLTFILWQVGQTCPLVDYCDAGQCNATKRLCASCITHCAVHSCVLMW